MERKREIGTAVEQVFKNNWNNSILTKAETMALLEMARPAIDLNEYATLTGVIQRSDEN